VRKLTVRDIDAFYRALVREEKLAPSTVRQIHNVLRGSLDQAVRWGWRSDNPARLARCRRGRSEGRGRRPPLDDLTTGELSITKAIVETRDRSVVEKDTKTHQAWRIALDADTVEVLRAWRTEVESRAKPFGIKVRPDGFVFSPELDGSQPWRPYHWTSAWRRLRDRVGIDSAVRLHDLRHFTAPGLWTLVYP
jgi:integrase